MLSLRRHCAHQWRRTGGICGTGRALLSTKESSRPYDFLVLGAGPGGIASARRAARYPDTRVAIVDPAPLGGICVNVGCVPKKLLFVAAEMRHKVLHEMPSFGFEGKQGSAMTDAVCFDWNKLKKSRDEHIHRLNTFYGRKLEESNVDIIPGAATFNSRGQVEVEGREIQAKHVLIAVGAKPFLPEMPGIEHCIDSDRFFALDEMPRNVAIIGAGYIATELGGVLGALGAHTTIFCREDGLLRGFDEMLRSQLHDAMQRIGVHVQPNSKVRNVLKASDGTKSVVLDDGNVHQGFDCVLVAAGRVAMTDSLNLQNIGVEVNSQGFIEVDEYQTTSIPHISAVGDVTGRAMLTPVSVAAGRRLADRLFGGQRDANISYDNIPTVVFSQPPLGTIGLTEAAARGQYSDIRVFTKTFVNLRHGIVAEVDSSNRVKPKPTTAIKLVCAGSDLKVVGLHVFGEGADEMLQGFSVAISMGATKADFDKCFAIHPTAAEEFVLLPPWQLLV